MLTLVCEFQVTRPEGRRPLQEQHRRRRQPQRL